MNAGRKILLASFLLIIAIGSGPLFSPALTETIGDKVGAQVLGRRDVDAGVAHGEVYFRLGNPSKIEGNTYTWFDGKPDGIPFTAIIESDALSSVNCL